MGFVLVLLAGFQLVRLPNPDKRPEDRFDENDFEEVTHWLVARLIPRVGDADAWDLVNEGLTESLPRGKRPWSRGGELTLAVHLVYAVTDLRRAKVRRSDFAVVGAPEEGDAPNALRSRLPEPEAVALRNDRHRRLHAAALAHFGESPKVLPVLERIQNGQWTSDEEHAHATGLSVKQVQNARDQVTAFVHAWQRREDGEDGAKRA
jgi:hypothetical protein